MATYLYDTFTGTAASLLTSHTADSGGTWPTDSDHHGHDFRLDGNGKVYTADTPGAYQLSGATMPSTRNFEIVYDMVRLSAMSGTTAGMFVLADLPSWTHYYIFFFGEGTGFYWSEDDVQVGSAFSTVPAVNTTWKIRLNITESSGDVTFASHYSTDGGDTWTSMGIDFVSESNTTPVNIGPSFSNGSTGESTTTGTHIGNLLVRDYAPSFVSDSIQVELSQTDQEVAFTGTDTYWLSDTPVFVASGVTGVSFGTVTVVDDTHATAPITTGSTSGTLTVTDSTSGLTCEITIQNFPSFVPDPTQVSLNQTDYEITFTGTLTTWETTAPVFVASGVSGVSLGTPTVISNTSATALITTGAIQGTATVTDTANETYHTCEILIQDATSFVPDPVQVELSKTNQTVTFTGTLTTWETNTPTFVASGVTGVSLGSTTVVSDTSATAPITTGSTSGTATITDTASNTTCQIIIQNFPSFVPIPTTIALHQTGHVMTFDGTLTNWVLVEPVFVASGVSGVSFGTPTVINAVSATVPITTGATAGTVTVTDSADETAHTCELSVQGLPSFTTIPTQVELNVTDQEVAFRGVNTYWSTDTPVFEASVVADVSFSDITVTDDTHATALITTGSALGTATISDTASWPTCELIIHNFVTFAPDPTQVPLNLTAHVMTFVGTKSLWLTETPVFVASGVDGVSFGSVTVVNDTHATVPITTGDTAGMLTVTDTYSDLTCELLIDGVQSFGTSPSRLGLNKTDFEVTFIGIYTYWLTDTPVFVASEVEGVSIGSVTVIDDTHATAPVTTGGVLGTATVTDSTSGLTCNLIIGKHRLMWVPTLPSRRHL